MSGCLSIVDLSTILPSCHSSVVALGKSFEVSKCRILGLQTWRGVSPHTRHWATQHSQRYFEIRFCCCGRWISCQRNRPRFFENGQHTLKLLHWHGTLLVHKSRTATDSLTPNGDALKQSAANLQVSGHPVEQGTSTWVRPLYVQILRTAAISSLLWTNHVTSKVSHSWRHLCSLGQKQSIIEKYSEWV